MLLLCHSFSEDENVAIEWCKQKWWGTKIRRKRKRTDSGTKISGNANYQLIMAWVNHRYDRYPDCACYELDKYQKTNKLILHWLLACTHDVSQNNRVHYAAICYVLMCEPCQPIWKMKPLKYIQINPLLFLQGCWNRMRVITLQFTFRWLALQDYSSIKIWELFLRKRPVVCGIVLYDELWWW